VRGPTLPNAKGPGSLAQGAGLAEAQRIARSGWGGTQDRRVSGPIGPSVSGYEPEFRPTSITHGGRASRRQGVEKNIDGALEIKPYEFERAE